MESAYLDWFISGRTLLTNIFYIFNRIHLGIITRSMPTVFQVCNLFVWVELRLDVGIKNTGILPVLIVIRRVLIVHFLFQV